MKLLFRSVICLSIVFNAGVASANQDSDRLMGLFEQYDTREAYSFAAVADMVALITGLLIGASDSKLTSELREAAFQVDHMGNLPTSEEERARNISQIEGRESSWTNNSYLHEKPTLTDKAERLIDAVKTSPIITADEKEKAFQSALQNFDEVKTRVTSKPGFKAAFRNRLLKAGLPIAAISDIALVAYGSSEYDMLDLPLLMRIPQALLQN